MQLALGGNNQHKKLDNHPYECRIQGTDITVISESSSNNVSSHIGRNNETATSLYYKEHDSLSAEKLTAAHEQTSDNHSYECRIEGTDTNVVSESSNNNVSHCIGSNNATVTSVTCNEHDSFSAEKLNTVKAQTCTITEFQEDENAKACSQIIKPGHSVFELREQEEQFYDFDDTVNDPDYNPNDSNEVPDNEIVLA